MPGRAVVPIVTWLDCIRTPPSLTGRPVMSTVRTPVAPRLRVVLSLTVTRSASPDSDWVTRPERLAVKGSAVNTPTGAVVVGGPDAAARCAPAAAGVPPANRLSGVPALRAHPDASGPPLSQTTSSAGATTLAVSPARRSVRWSGHPEATRHQ